MQQDAQEFMAFLLDGLHEVNVMVRTEIASPEVNSNQQPISSGYVRVFSSQKESCTKMLMSNTQQLQISQCAHNLAVMVITIASGKLS